MGVLTVKHVSVGTTASQIMKAGDLPEHAEIIFQSASGASCFVGPSTVTSTGSTMGILVPTSNSSGSAPCSLRLGGVDLWAVTGVGTTELVIAFVGPPYTGFSY